MSMGEERGEEMGSAQGEGTMMTGNSESEVAYEDGVRIRDRTKWEELGACRN